MEGAHPVTDVNACVSDVLKRGLDDWVDSAEVAWVVQSIGKQTATADISRMALEVIAELLRGELMKAGDVTSTGFEEWNLAPDQAIERIAAEWAIDRSPGLGEIFWLSNTSKGDRMARAAS